MAAVFDTPIRTSAANLERVLAAGRPMLIVFETPNCAPCRGLDPTLTELARAFAGRALIVRVENAEEANLPMRFRLTRVPTLVYWQSGREVARIDGAADAGSIRAWLEFMLGSGPRPTPTSGPSVPLGGAPSARPSASTAGSSGAYTRPSAGASAPGTAGRNGGPIVVTDATFASQVLQAQLPVLVDFWAPWCGPCRIISPVVEELGRQYAGRLRVAKMNTDENPNEAGRLGIMGIPTLIFFRNGREVDRIVGVVPKANLQSRVERVLGTG